MFNAAPGPGVLSGTTNTRLPCVVKKSCRSRASACRSSGEGLGTVHLLDYGAGNVRSVKNAIRRLGYNFIEVEQVADIATADRLIFPGVGSYGQAMERLKQLGYTEALKDYIQSGKPFLGICLGLQLLFEGSTESGGVEGLNIIPGAVAEFDRSMGLPVPHIGWNSLESRQDSRLLNNNEGQRYYFVHSYRALPSEHNKDWVLSTSHYGEDFVSAVQRGDTYATQFHPEKSGAAGLKVLENFFSSYTGKGPQPAASVQNLQRQQQQQQQNLNGNALIVVQIVIYLPPVLSTEVYLSLRTGTAHGVIQTVVDLPAVLPTDTSLSLRTGNAHGLAKRVIACLDVRANDAGDLVVTKGDQYDVRDSSTSANDVRNLGLPVELAGRYFKEGADEVTFLNITGFRDFPLGDLPMLEVLRQASEGVFVPLTVGGGIRGFTDGQGKQWSALEVAAEYFRSGADKISIGGDAVFAAEEYRRTGEKTGTSSIEQISWHYGAQAVVVSIDPRRVFVSDSAECSHNVIKTQWPGPKGEEYCWYQCTVKGGREGRDIDAVELAQAVEALGAGEILLNCIDSDGACNGFDLELVQAVSEAVTIPVIASSGAGSPDHFSEVFNRTKASAALAAGIFHRKEVAISDVKDHMVAKGLPTRA